MAENTDVGRKIDAARADEALLDALYRGGLDEIADLAFDILGNPVFIRDNSQSLLAVTRKGGPFDHYISSLQDRGYFDQKTIDDIKKHKQQYVDVYTKDRPVYIENRAFLEQNLLSLAVYFKNVIIGYVTVVECCQKIETGDAELLIKIGKAVAIAI